MQFWRSCPNIKVLDYFAQLLDNVWKDFNSIIFNRFQLLSFSRQLHQTIFSSVNSMSRCCCKNHRSMWRFVYITTKNLFWIDYFSLGFSLSSCRHFSVVWRFRCSSTISLAGMRPFESNSFPKVQSKHSDQSFIKAWFQKRSKSVVSKRTHPSKDLFRCSLICVLLCSCEV